MKMVYLGSLIEQTDNYNKLKSNLEMGKSQTQNTSRLKAVRWKNDLHQSCQCHHIWCVQCTARNEKFKDILIPQDKESKTSLQSESSQPNTYVASHGPRAKVLIVRNKKQDRANNNELKPNHTPLLKRETPAPSSRLLRRSEPAILVNNKRKSKPVSWHQRRRRNSRAKFRHEDIELIKLGSDSTKSPVKLVSTPKRSSISVSASLSVIKPIVSSRIPEQTTFSQTPEETDPIHITLPELSPCTNTTQPEGMLQGSDADTSTVLSPTGRHKLPITGIPKRGSIAEPAAKKLNVDETSEAVEGIRLNFYREINPDPDKGQMTEHEDDYALNENTESESLPVDLSRRSDESKKTVGEEASGENVTARKEDEETIPKSSIEEISRKYSSGAEDCVIVDWQYSTRSESDSRSIELSQSTQPTDVNRFMPSVITKVPTVYQISTEESQNTPRQSFQEPQRPIPRKASHCSSSVNHIGSHPQPAMPWRYIPIAEQLPNASGPGIVSGQPARGKATSRRRSTICLSDTKQMTPPVPGGFPALSKTCVRRRPSTHNTPETSESSANNLEHYAIPRPPPPSYPMSPGITSGQPRRARIGLRRQTMHENSDTHFSQFSPRQRSPVCPSATPIATVSSQFPRVNFQVPLGSAGSSASSSPILNNNVPLQQPLFNPWYQQSLRFSQVPAQWMSSLHYKSTLNAMEYSEEVQLLEQFVYLQMCPVELYSKYKYMTSCQVNLGCLPDSFRTFYARCVNNSS